MYQKRYASPQHERNSFMGIWGVHITFSCLPNRQDGTLIVFVTLFPEVELIHEKDTCLKQRCALQKEVWFQKENNTQQPEFCLNHLPSFIQKCGTELLGLNNIQDKSETNAQTKQPLFSVSGLFWSTSCPAQKSSLSFIGKEGRIEGMTSLLLPST